jgi:hypothetical protein
MFHLILNERREADLKVKFGRSIVVDNKYISMMAKIWVIKINKIAILIKSRN